MDRPGVTIREAAPEEYETLGVYERPLPDGL